MYGDDVTASHIWVNQGTYVVKVKAKDTSDIESVWSDPLGVSMPKSKSYNIRDFLICFLDDHPLMFPILKQILGLN